MEIDRDVMEQLNSKFKRKRMISVYFLIRKILCEMGHNDYRKIDFKISIQTLENYEQWWRYYKSINSTVKRPVNNTC